ncbi:MAG: hypothetical protein AAF916_04085, partial [Planctomycetota bacterium]
GRRIERRPRGEDLLQADPKAASRRVSVADDGSRVPPKASHADGYRFAADSSGSRYAGPGSEVTTGGGAMGGGMASSHRTSAGEFLSAFFGK